MMNLKAPGLLILLCLLPLITVNGYQTPMEVTGNAGSYAFSSGQYTVQMYSDGSGESWSDRPVAYYTYVAERDGVVYFSRVVGEGESPFILGRFPGSEWGEVSDGFEVNRGDVVELKIWPYGSYVTRDENPNDEYYELIYTYAKQTGYIKYTLLYYDDDSSGGESELIVDFDYSPISPSPGDQVEITSKSTVEGAEIISMSWYVNGERVLAHEGEGYWVWTAPSIGTYTVELEVTDSTRKTDFHIEEITVKEESSYTIIDQAFTKSIQDNEPVGKSTGFRYGDEVIFWMKLGNVKGSHRVYVEWETPRPNEIIGIEYIDIPSPTTQGKTEWTEYTVLASIKPGDDRYELLFRDPGDWKTKVLIDSDSYEYSFQIESNLVHEATVEKTKYTTGETITVEGTLVFNGAAIEEASIRPIIYRKGAFHDAPPEISVGTDGRYSFRYKIEPLDLESEPIGPENWSLRLSPLIDSQYGQQYKEIMLEVLPVWMTIKDAKIVQVIEAPVISDGFFNVPHIAANRQAGVRVLLEWHGYEEGFMLPELDVYFSQENRDTGSAYTTTEKPVIVDGIIYADFFFTLPSGLYMFSSEIDRDGFYIKQETREANIDALAWEQICRSKKMEPLKLKFMLINVNWEKPNIQSDEIRWIEKQKQVFKDTYPVPLEDMYFEVAKDTRTFPDLGAIGLNRFTLGKALSVVSYYEGSKIIGVTPDSQNYWKPEESGYSEYYMRSPLLTKYIDTVSPYNSRMVLVKYGAQPGVSAHEIGHTLGLYQYYGEEQYQLHPPYGEQCYGLILRDGAIYNVSNRNEVREAFPEKRPRPGIAMCFMGNSPVFVQPAGRRTFVTTWISDDSMPTLFKSLMDPPHERTLLVMGRTYENGTTEFDNFYPGYGLPDKQDEGAYTVECQDTGGNVLYSNNFGNAPVEYTDFVISVAYPEETAKIVLKLNGAIVGEATPSPNTPVVTHVEVNGGPIVNIEWEAHDPDGDPLTYTVLYNYDERESWEVVAVNHKEQSLEMDLEKYPGSYAKIKVIANDGFNSGEGTSDTLTKAPMKPVCAITNLDNNTILDSREVLLTGASLDYDSEVSEDQYSWYSDSDGYLGSGSELSTQLSLGEHLITLTLDDYTGDPVTDIVSVTIVEAKATLFEHVVASLLDSNNDPIDQKNQFHTRDKVYSWIEIHNSTGTEEIRWIYTGPKGITAEATITTGDTGTVTASSVLDLAYYNETQSIGDWSIQVYINTELVDTQSFTVTKTKEPPTGLTWWGPFVGVSIIVALIAGGVILLKRRKRLKNSQTSTCPNCGQTATWIEEYRRWYCYQCEKYLE